MEREKAIEILQRLSDSKSEELYIFDDEGGDICGQILEEQDAILAGIEALKETERNPTITSWYDFDRGYEKGKASAIPHGEWIPCSKRLPEIRFDLNSRTSDTVFVCLENRTMHMAFYCEDDVWRFCESGEAKEPMWDKVIAWMPLPERYKKEGE